MKTICQLLCLLLLTAVCNRHTSAEHQLAGIHQVPGGSVVLAIDGSVATTNIFRNYFQIVPLEASSDLATWTPITSLLRTNLTSNVVSFSQTLPVTGTRRFLRTAVRQSHTPFPEPTGPYAVGTASRLLTDSRRINRFGYATNSSFMITVWYPAASRLEGALAPYNHPLIASNRNYWINQALARIPSFVTHARVDGPVAAQPARTFPVILYSHGLGADSGRGVRTENTARCVELSSHGYVIVSLDHTDTFATVLPGDRLLLGRIDAFSDAPRFHTNRLADIDFLITQLASLNSSDPLLAGIFDLERIGIMGWSFGGGTAGDCLRVNDRIRAAVLLDGYLSARPDLLRDGVQKPILSMSSPDSGLYPEALNLYNTTTKDSFLMQVKGASHNAFTDNEWTVSPSSASRTRAMVMNACALSFFNKYLAEIDDRLLENPQSTFPQISLFKRK